MPAFQVEGRFDPETYQNQLRASGMSVPAFEQSFRDDTALNQFRTGITDTAFTLPQEAERLAALGRQTRTVEAVRFDFALAQEGIEVTEEEVAAYFTENADNYQFPQRTKIDYIELDSSVVASEIEISDEQALEYYESNRGRYMRAEQREASHILLDTEDASEEEQVAVLQEVKARVEAGESFSDLAAEFSIDVGSSDNGGSLGVISQDVMDPAFEEAVYSLANVDDVSDPVITDAGVHLIKVDAIQPESGKPFEEVKDEIIATMQQDEADREFFDLRDILAEQSFDNPGSLEPAADATGLEIKSSDWLDIDTDSGPVLSDPRVANAMTSPDVLDDENNSDVIELGDRHIMVLRVVEHEGPRPKALDDVRDQVEDELKGSIAKDELQAKVDAALEKLTAGSTAEEVAQDDELAEAFTAEILDRQSIVFDANVISRIFSLPAPTGDAITDSTTLANGDQLALRLDAIETPEAAADNDEDDSTATPSVAGVLEPGVNPSLGGVEFEALLESLREKADVELLSDS